MSADYERNIIAKLTRNGSVVWPAVASALGRSLDSVRSQYDTTYLKSRPWPHPCEAIEPEETTKQRARVLADAIIARLTIGPADAETIAGYITKNVGSVRVRLSQMQHEGAVERDRGQRPCMWRLKVVADHG